MKKFVRFSGLLSIAVMLFGNGAPSYAGGAQQPQAGQPPQQQTQPLPGPGKKFVQNIFGLVEVDMSDPRPAVAVGPPLQPAPAPAPPPGVAAQPPPAAQAPTQAPAQGDQIVPVSLHFDNTDLHQVIRILGDVLQINYVIDPGVRGTVNINTSGDVRRSDLLPILEAILKMNGATMVKAGNFYQIVPANTAARMPIEVQRTQSSVAPDDQVVLQIVPMKFVAAEEMLRLLTPYVSEAGNILAQGGVLLITDRRSNLRKLLEVVDEFDSKAFLGQRVRLFPVKNNRVKDVVDDLKTVFGGYALSANSNSAIRFLPIERMNSVLVVTPDSTVFSEVERWLDRLDQPVRTAGVRNFVYRAKNSKASDLQKVLSELYGGGQQQATGAGSPQSPAGAVPIAAISSTASAGAAAAVSQTSATTNIGTWVSPGQLRIIADSVNNALVIQATPQDYEQIERALEELDVLPRQVLIDAQIYEVVLDHGMSLGLSANLQNRGTLNPAQTTAGVDTSGNVTGTTFAFIGRTRELVTFLNASENSSRVRTLSAPSILVSNNSSAQIEVGSEIPIPGSTSFTPLGGTNQTILFRDTGVLLNVTPQINEGGTVTLKIIQEVSEASANTTSAIVAPVIGKSAANSTVVTHSGETIALSGFIRDNQEISRNRIPLLGSIPGVGLLFGSTTKSVSRTELIVLITPHVITTAEESSAATEELKARLKEIQKMMN